MILAGGTLRFVREHAERLLEYSKTAALSSFSVFAYSLATIITIILGAEYLSIPTTDVISMAVETFSQSPIQILVFTLFTLIVYKIDLLKCLRLCNPHDHHPVIDFAIGLPIAGIGLIGLLSVLDMLTPYTSSASDGLYVLADILFLVVGASAAMFCAAVAVNGGCRFLINGITGLLALRRIKEAPTLFVEWVLRQFDRVRYIVNAYQTVCAYADEEDIPEPIAAGRIFDIGLEQIELSEDSTDEEDRNVGDEGEGVEVTHPE